MEQAFICYTYEYAKGIPVRGIRDYDNLEAKEVLDVINAFFYWMTVVLFVSCIIAQRSEKRTAHI